VQEECIGKRDGGRKEQMAQRAKRKKWDGRLDRV
jgi:hypothetical protein